MSLPDCMSPGTIAIIKATAPIVGPKALEITQTFYPMMLGDHPELFAFFNRANQAKGKQPQALAAAICAYATHVDQLDVLGPAVELMAVKHCGLQVLPEHYAIVHKYVMQAVAKVLGDVVTPEIGAAWSEAVLFLAKVLIDREEALYKEAEARRGGWRGWRDFTLVAKEQAATDIVTFTFEQPQAGPIDFTAGQFVSVRVDPAGDSRTSPRHYTVTSAPGDPFLQISVKKIPGGIVSNFLHELPVGQTVQLSPPFGAFTPGTGSAVLVSAGIGITPMVALQRSLDVQLAVHVDRTEAAHAFRGAFPCQSLYSADGRPDADQIAAAALGAGAEHDFYVCGPGSFMKDVKQAIANRGVSAGRIHHEAFGPQLAS